MIACLLNRLVYLRRSSQALQTLTENEKIYKKKFTTKKNKATTGATGQSIPKLPRLVETQPPAPATTVTTELPRLVETQPSAPAPLTHIHVVQVASDHQYH